MAFTFHKLLCVYIYRLKSELTPSPLVNNWQPSTMIVWTELCCWLRNYKNYSCLKWQWNFYFLTKLYPSNADLNLTIWVTRWVSYKKQVTDYFSRLHVCQSPRLFGGIQVVHIFLSFLCCDFCFVCLRTVSLSHWHLCRWIVNSWLPLRFSLTFIFTCFQLFSNFFNV